MQNTIYYDESTGIPQYGFTLAQLDDLIGYVHENRKSGFGLLSDHIPLFDSTFIINIYHPAAPDTYSLYLYKDEHECWWPYATLDCLCDIKTLLKSI